MAPDQPELVTVEAAKLQAILDEIHEMREILTRYLAPVPLPPTPDRAGPQPARGRHA